MASSLSSSSSSPPMSTDNVIQSLVLRYDEIQRQQTSTSRRPRRPLNPRNSSEAEMIQRLESTAKQFEFYEDLDLQDQARSKVPVDRLHEEAHKMETSDGEDFQDLLLRRLLHWFKHDFFTWVNEPSCDSCKSATQGRGMTPPTPDEIRFGGSRVELYQCLTCTKMTRFPRYNHPGKLLETRRGRCGEWANCFALICRAMGFETRYILDFTDHVWTEVFSVAKNRWVHADSCENAYDSPLMYEAGWGKSLNYVFAFTGYEVRDVYRRYTRKFDEVLGRRTQVPERWLSTLCQAMTNAMGAKISADVQTEHRDRRHTEDVEFLAVLFQDFQLKEAETAGRQSGSLQWRTERGEIGDRL